jgi:acyl-coenzyme A synthetase/AMP-(fatty) acid ligase
LKDSGPRILITIPELLETAMKALSGTKVEKVFVFGSVGVKDVKTVKDLEKAGEKTIIPKITIKDVKTRACFLCYSSGTTGSPFSFH